MTPAELFQHSRRDFLKKCGMGLGAAALATMLQRDLLAATPSTQVMRVYMAKVSFDPVKDFQPVSQITTSAALIIANPAFPASTMRELVDYAKKNPGKVSFGTEAAHFQRRGIPAVVCGPGSIAQAHKADEYVEIEQVLKCEEFMRRLMARICTDTGEGHR